jgi:hypothetical protein
MSAEFSIDVDTDRNLVRIVMAGFFDAAGIARFDAARHEAYRRLTCGPNAHDTLVDIREMQIQSQESIADFQRLLSGSALRGRRIAFVVSKALARLQVQRTAQGRLVDYFGTVETAEGWLMRPADA